MAKSIKELNTMPRIDRHNHWKSLSDNEKTQQWQIILNRYNRPFSNTNYNSLIIRIVIYAIIMRIGLYFIKGGS